MLIFFVLNGISSLLLWKSRSRKMVGERCHRELHVNMEFTSYIDMSGHYHFNMGSTSTLHRYACAGDIAQDSGCRSRSRDILVCFMVRDRRIQMILSINHVGGIKGLYKIKNLTRNNDECWQEVVNDNRWWEFTVIISSYTII